MRLWFVVLIASLALSAACNYDWIGREMDAWERRGAPVAFVDRVIYLVIAGASAVVISIAWGEIVAAVQVWP